MAEEIAFKVVIEAADSAQTLGEVKQSIKDITGALEKVPVGSKAFGDLTVALGKAKANMTDLKEQVKALDPEKRFAAIGKIGSSIASGFAAAQAATALFGTESEDLTKTLVKVQAATALAQGLQGLAGFTKALNTARLAMIAFAVSNPFTAIIAAVAALGIAVGILTHKWMESQLESNKMAASVEKLTAAYNLNKGAIENEIKILTAYGDRQDEVILKKRELIMLDIKAAELALMKAEAVAKESFETDDLIGKLLRLYNPTLAAVRKAERIGEAAHEVHIQKKKLEDLKTDLTVSFIEENKEKKKNNDIKLKEEQKYQDLLEDLKPDPNEFTDPLEIVPNVQAEMHESMIENQTNFQDISIENWKDYFKRLKEEADKKAEEEKQQLEYRKNLEIQLTEQSITAIGNLTNTMFENRLNRANISAEQEYKIKKRQFQFNKTLTATEAAIDTIKAVQKNYSQGGLAVGSAMNIIQIAIGAANVAAILAKKYPPFEGGGSDSGASPGSTGGGSTPWLQPPSSQQNQLNSTDINTDANGNFKGFNRKDNQIKAYVVESEITETQSKIKSIKERNTF